MPLVSLHHQNKATITKITIKTWLIYNKDSKENSKDVKNYTIFLKEPDKPKKPYLREQYLVNGGVANLSDLLRKRTMNNNDKIRSDTWDCLEVMKYIPDGSIDAIITDPPILINWTTVCKGFCDSFEPMWNELKES